MGVRIFGADLRCAACDACAIDVAPEFPVMCDEPEPDTIYLMDPDYSRWWVTWTCEAGHKNVTGKLDKQPVVVTRVYR